VHLAIQNAPPPNGSPERISLMHITKQIKPVDTNSVRVINPKRPAVSAAFHIMKLPPIMITTPIDHIWNSLPCLISLGKASILHKKDKFNGFVTA